MKPAVFAEARAAGFLCLFKIQDKGRQHSGQLLEKGEKFRNFAAWKMLRLWGYEVASRRRWTLKPYNLKIWQPYNLKTL